MPLSLQALSPVLTTRRQQMAARGLLAAIARHGPFCDFTFIRDRLATGGAVTTEADIEAVVEAGINTLIDCRAEFAPHAAQFQEYLATAHPQITYHFCPAADDGQPKDALWFAQGIEAAITALERPESCVLVYCALGINRGPSMTYAIMRACSFDGDEAAGLLMDKRPIVGLAYRADADAAVTCLGYSPLSPSLHARTMGTVITHGWHFVTGRKTSPVGVTEWWDGPLVAGRYGLHGSERALDALSYIPKFPESARQDVCVRWCAFSGQVVTGDREFVASERTALWSADATPALRDFAAWCIEDLKQQAEDMTELQAVRQEALSRIGPTKVWCTHDNPVYAAEGASQAALGGPMNWWVGDRATVMARRRYSLYLEGLLEKLAPGHEQEAKELRDAREAEDARRTEDASEAKGRAQTFVGMAWQSAGRAVVLHAHTTVKESR